ncbi:Resolvase/invertase-type recombinase catalytic domain-containing protein [Vibrio chagasii]|nr:Resolvase/invertase-type recombinase catalytic domain-containing protein [Vibrio chagasii]
MNPRIYSYSRISSERQSSGTGIAQQKDIDVLSRLAHKYNMPVSKEVFSDIGKSAYKGEHLKSDFGRILAMIDDGRITTGSIIAITSLDRLSRQDVNVALELFLSVINKGVAIYTSIDDKLYSPTDENLSASLIVSIIYLERANNESKTKGARTVGSVKATYKQIMEGNAGGRDSDGYCKAINAVGNNVWWSETSSGFVKPHPIYFPIMRELVDLSLKMYSIVQLKEHLQQYDPPQIMKGRWSYDFVSKFHNMRALIGRKEINLDGDKLVIPDYYPPVCSEDELLQIQAIRRKRNTRSSALVDKPTGLLSGLNVLKCSKCGGGMAHIHKSNRAPRYVCSNGINSRGCDNWGFLQDGLDRFIIQRARFKAFQSMVPKATGELRKLAQNRLVLESKLAEEMETYQAVKEAGKKVPRILMFEISDIEEKIDHIDEQLHDIRLKGAGSVLNQTWREMFSEYAESDFIDASQMELRLRFKQVLKQMISRIESERTDKKVGRTYEIRHKIVWEDGEEQEVIL